MEPGQPPKPEDLKKRIEDLEGKEAHLRVIHDFALQLLPQTSVEEVVWAVAKNAVACLGFEDCVVYLVDEKSNQLIQVAAHGPKNPADLNIKNPIAIPMGEGIVGSAAATGQPQLVTDTRKDSRYILDDEERLSELAAPIIHDGKVIGVIDSEDHRIGFYTQDHIRLLTTIASMTSFKLANAMAVDRLNNTVEQLKQAEKLQHALYEIANLAWSAPNLDGFFRTLHGLIAELTYAANFFVAILEPGKMISFPYWVDGGMPAPDPMALEDIKLSPTGYVIQSGNGLHWLDPKLNSEHLAVRGPLMEDWVGAPLKDEGEVIGALVIQSYRKDKLYTSADLELMMYVSKHVATTLLRFRAREELERKVSERTRDLEIANREKDRFLANMSHELRTPMNGILGMTGLLLETNLQQEQRDCVETVKISADSMVAIINDVLEISKSEVGKLQLSHDDFNLRVCVEEVVVLYAVEIQNKGLDLQLVYEPDLLSMVKGDHVRLRQVLINLISNAIKFTSHGHIRVDVRMLSADDGRQTTLFQISDTGIGIKGEYLDRVFEPFSQADPSSTRAYGGAGLGLSISKQLVEAMGGEISVISEEGGGAVFRFTVPLDIAGDGKEPIRLKIPTKVLVVCEKALDARALNCQLKALGAEFTFLDGLDQVRAQLESNPVHTVIFDLPGSEKEVAHLGEWLVRMKKVNVIVISAVTSLTMDPQSWQGIRRLAKPIRFRQLYQALIQETEPTPTVIKDDVSTGDTRILLVEDNPVNRKVAQRILEKRGWHCDVAENGVNALDMLKKETYTLVLMDVQMPVMDGLEATRSIREMDEFAKLPIVALTANAMSGDREKCLEAGMNDYLSKPIRPQELRDMVSRYLP